MPHGVGFLLSASSHLVSSASTTACGGWTEKTGTEFGSTASLTTRFLVRCFLVTCFLVTCAFANGVFSEDLKHLNVLINSAAWAMLIVARGTLALVAVVAVALVAEVAVALVAEVAAALVLMVAAGLVVMSLVTAGVAVAGCMVAGFVVLVGTSPVVSLVSSWLVGAAPLRALRALEALLRVLPFTGWAISAGSTVLTLVAAGFTVLMVSFTGWAILTCSTGLTALAVWVTATFALTAVLPASAAAFSSAATMARVLRPVCTLAVSESATGAGVEADLVFLRGAMVSRVVRCVVKVSGKLGIEVKWLYVVVRVLVVESVLCLVNENWRKEGRDLFEGVRL